MESVIEGQDRGYDVLLDVSGLVCPLPILKAKAALAHMPVGQTLKVLVTHRDSTREFPMLSRLEEFELIQQLETAEDFQFWITRVAESGG